MKNIGLLLLAGLCLIGVILTAQAKGADIAGLKPGMTPEQVEAAVNAWSDKYSVQIYDGQYDYSNGVQNLKTETFISEIKLAPTANPYLPHFEVHFAPTVAGGKAIYITRRGTYSLGGGPSTQNYREALIGKYGKETQDNSIPLNLILIWANDEGKKNCITRKITGTGLLSPETMVQLVNESGIPVEECSNWLIYHAANDPVAQESAVLTDLVALMVANKATDEWLVNLEAKAKEELKQKSGSIKPLL